MSFITQEITTAFTAAKTHAAELLRGFRSGVAVYEEHLLEHLAKLEALEAELFGSAPPAPAPAPDPVVAAQPEPAPTPEVPAADPAPVEAPAPDAPQA